MSNNKKTTRHLIHGILRTASDFTVSAFGQGYYDLSDPARPQVRAGAPAKGSADKYPCTRTVKLPMVLNAATRAGLEASLVPVDPSEQIYAEAPEESAAAETGPASAEGGNGKPKRASAVVLLPVIPSTLIRGRLRREMTEAVLDVIEERDDMIDLGVYRGLTSGSATGKPDGVGATFAQIADCMRSPLVGLFGGGPRLIESALTTCTSYPVCDATLNVGMVPPAFETYKNDVHPLQMTTVRVRTRKDDSIGGSMAGADKMGVGGSLNLRMLDVVEDAPTAVADWLRELSEGAADDEAAKAAPGKDKAAGAEGSDAKGSGRSKLKVSNIFCTESVVPGVNFYTRFIVDNRFQEVAGLGLFLLSLQRFANIQRLGSMGAHGFGMFDLELSITDADDPSAPAVPLFTREMGTSRYVLNTAAPVVKEALEAWERYGEKVTSVELANLYVPPSTPKEGGKKAKGGKEAALAA